MRFHNVPTRLDRYIFRQLFWGLIAVTTGLTALIWLTQSLRFIELVVNRGLSMLVFMQLTGLLIPSFIAVILPITTYVVIQFMYNRLSGAPGPRGGAARDNRWLLAQSLRRALHPRVVSGVPMGNS